MGTCPLRAALGGALASVGAPLGAEEHGAGRRPARGGGGCARRARARRSARRGRGPRPGRGPAREEAQVEDDRFGGVARHVGVDGDGGELLLGLGAEERQVEVGLGAPPDALEEAQDDVSRLHVSSARNALAEQIARPLEIGEGHPLVGGVRLRDVARAEHDRVDAGARRASPPRSRRRGRAARRRGRRAAAEAAELARVERRVGPAPRRAGAGARARSPRELGRDRRRVDCPGGGAQRERERGLVGHDVERDAAVELGDVHAHAPEAGRAHARAAPRPHSSQATASARQLDDRRRHVVGARRVAAAAARVRLERQDAAVAGARRGSRSARRRCALVEPARVRARGEERAHAGAAVLLVAGERIAVSRGRASVERGEDGGDRALGVAAPSPTTRPPSTRAGERIAVQPGVRPGRCRGAR